MPGQPPLEELGEQMVVAEPFALVVQGDDEQLLVLQAHEHVQAVATSGQRIAQFRIELVEHRGLVEEQLQVGGQAGQHVFRQVVGDVPFGPGEPAEETFPVGIATEGQGRQVQRRDPAFGALEQQLQLALAQLQPLEIEEKRIALLARKSQVFRAQAEGPGLEGRLVDQEARAEAGRGHHPHVIGQVLDQVANPMRQGGVADAVEIVEEQVQGTFQATQVGEEGIQDTLQRHRDVGAEQIGGIAAECRDHSLDARQQVLDQTLRFAVGLVAGQPCHRRALLQQAQAQLAEDGALAEAGRRAEHHRASPAGLVQAVDQRLAGKQRQPSGAWREQLGLQQRDGAGGNTVAMAHGQRRLSSRARRIAWVRLRTLSFS